MIKAVIFDLDGLIIDSEPLWRKAEMLIFLTHGINLTEEDCKGTRGMRLDEVIVHWAWKFPEAVLDFESVEQEVTDKVCQLIAEQGVAMPGVYKAIKYFEQINLPMAIASASSLKIINIVLEKLKLENRFTLIQSAEYLSYGKPHPEVFLKTAEKLNVLPRECLVLEDSLFGVIAGKAARMKVLAIPDEENFSNMEFCIADKKLPSLTEFDTAVWNTLNG